MLKWRRWQLIQWITCRRYRGDPLTGRALRSNVPRGSLQARAPSRACKHALPDSGWVILPKNGRVEN